MISKTIYKTIGIVGGMGPEAGYALGNSILKNTQASKDQQHLPVVLLSFPDCIGDRTAFLEGEINENPGHEIAKLISKLESVGAEVVGIACNTAHAPKIFHVILKELVAKQSHVKLLNMPWETSKFIKSNYQNIRRIGLMTSNGTYRAGIYSHALQRMGFEIVKPAFDFQNEVIHRLIYDPEFGIKANPGKVKRNARILLNKALGFFKENGAELLILGCTEIPAVLSGKRVQDMILLNPADVLAKALIKSACTSPIQKFKTLTKTNF